MMLMVVMMMVVVMMILMVVMILILMVVMILILMVVMILILMVVMMMVVMMMVVVVMNINACKHLFQKDCCLTGRAFIHCHGNVKTGCIVGFSIGAVVVVKLVNDYNELW